MITIDPERLSAIGFIEPEEGLFAAYYAERDGEYIIGSCIPGRAPTKIAVILGDDQICQQPSDTLVGYTYYANECSPKTWVFLLRELLSTIGQQAFGSVRITGVS